jgi:hypothetical protein
MEELVLLEINLQEENNIQYKEMIKNKFKSKISIVIHMINLKEKWQQFQEI